MCAPSPKRIGNFLSPGSGQLGAIINHIQLLQRLTRSLESLLPEPLRGHCRVAAVGRHTLVVHADSAAWATRIRYLSAELATAMKRQFAHHWLEDIQVKVRPPTALLQTVPAPGQTPDSPEIKLSPSHATPLRDATASLATLGVPQALNRLAKRGPIR